jgi:hypothetical protein
VLILAGRGIVESLPYRCRRAPRHVCGGPCTTGDCPPAGRNKHDAMESGIRCGPSTTPTRPKSTTSTAMSAPRSKTRSSGTAPVNEAMNAAEVKLIDGWSDIVRSWENTR